MKQIAKVLLYDDKDNVLIVRRSQSHPLYAYQPDLPGGIVEPNETPEQGAVREVAEEAGVAIPAVTLVYRVQYSPSTEYLVYEAHVTGTKPAIVISWEHDQYEWLPVAAVLGAPLPDGVDSYYETVIRYLKTRQ